MFPVWMSSLSVICVPCWIVFPACDLCYLLDFIKLSFCEFLVPDSLLQRTWQKDQPKQLPLRLPSVLFINITQFFVSVVCALMDPLLCPEFLLLLLEQGERSLEDHTRLFLLFAHTTSYPDDVLCAFYNASLNTASRALSSEDGPREDFASFMEWTLARNGSPFTVSAVDDLARSTPDPEPSPPSPRGAEHQPEPTGDGEPFPAAINEPAQSRATERKIAPEVEPNPSDQVREPATVPTTREPAVDGVSAEWSSAPCTVAEGELILHLGLLDMEGDLIDWETELEYEMPPLLSSSSPLVLSSLGGGLRFSSAHSLEMPACSCLLHRCRPQPPICTVRAPRVCHPPASPGLEYPSPQPPASEAQTPPRPVVPVAPPRLLAPSPPPSPIDPPAPLGSLILRLRLGWASTRHRLGTPLLWLCRDALSHRFCWAPSSLQLHLGPQSLRLHRGSPDLRLSRQSPRLHLGPPDPWHPPGSLALHLRLGLLHHLLRRRWSAAITPPWLLPLLAPPWAIIMAVAWVQLCASCSWFLLSLPWLHPPSSPPWSLSAGPLPGVRPPPEPPPWSPPLCCSTVRGRTFREEGVMSRPWTVLCVFCSPCVLWPSFSLMLIV